MDTIGRRGVGVWLVVALVALAGAAPWMTGVLADRAPHAEPHLAWPLLIVLFALAERARVHVPVGRETHTLTLIEVPLVLGLVLASPRDLVLAYVVGPALVHLLDRHQERVKQAFNSAACLVSASVALLLFDGLLGSAEALSARGWAAAGAAAVAANLAVSLALHLVLRIRTGEWSWRTVVAALPGETLTQVGAAQLGLVAALVVSVNPWAAVLLVGLVAVLLSLHHGYLELRQRKERLELLVEFTSAVDAALADESVEEAVAAQARRMLRAEHAVVVPADRSAEAAAPGAWWRPAFDGQTVRLSRSRSRAPHPGLRGTGASDAMAAPLRTDGTVTGALLVTDRLDQMSTFDGEDARLLEALAGHAALSLANAGLLEQVRDEAAARDRAARVDRLTGLPNRHGFAYALEEALAEGSPLAVVLLDLDGFKEVNDTLGHPAGDTVLREVAHRLVGAVRAGTVVARLGGDEFALLLSGESVALEPVAVVERVLDAVGHPVAVGEVDLDVSGSAGVALSPADGNTADVLLRATETAMYRAKRRRGVAVRYDLAQDAPDPRRLTLVTDLAQALERGDLVLHYQPQYAVDDRRIVGVEALLRWTHPVWGDVSPGEFMPLAEQTRLVRPLTRYVLDAALRQCAAWAALGTPVTVAVNVSASNLLEPDLSTDVAAMLVRYGVPAELLVIEITESAITEDEVHAVEVLRRLADLGVGVSVDDFGTGHSSLTRLTSLRVHEVKVDRSFVQPLVASERHAAVVRSVVSLGHDLGLRVVAEGVEDEATWDALAALGCDRVQGFLLARPAPAARVTLLLAEDRDRHTTPLRRLRLSEDAGQRQATGT